MRGLAEKQADIADVRVETELRMGRVSKDEPKGHEQWEFGRIRVSAHTKDPAARNTN